MKVDLVASSIRSISEKIKELALAFKEGEDFMSEVMNVIFSRKVDDLGTGITLRDVVLFQKDDISVVLKHESGVVKITVSFSPYTIPKEVEDVLGTSILKSINDVRLSSFIAVAVIVKYADRILEALKKVEEHIEEASKGVKKFIERVKSALGDLLTISLAGENNEY